MRFWHSRLLPFHEMFDSGELTVQMPLFLNVVKNPNSPIPDRTMDLLMTSRQSDTDGFGTGMLDGIIQHFGKCIVD
jgi:hypothetical protein